MKMKTLRTCLRCGCTDHRACLDEFLQPCSWVGQSDVCSACLTPRERNLYMTLRTKSDLRAFEQTLNRISKPALALLLALAFILPARAQPSGQPETAVRRDAALLSLVCFTNRLATLTRAQWEKVNVARTAQSLALFPYEVARTNFGVNEPYVLMLLVMIETEITPAFQAKFQRHPFTREVLVAWAIGVPKFKRLGYDLKRVTDPRVQLLLQKEEHERDRLLTRRDPPMPPPPLPGSPGQTLPLRSP